MIGNYGDQGVWPLSIPIRDGNSGWCIVTFVQVSEKITLLTDGTTLMLLRLDFLRIICSHEHFYPLNLPFGTPLTPSGGASSPTPSVVSTNSQASYISTSTLTEKGMYYELTMEFRQQHFLVGLMLSDLTTALETK